MDMVDEERFEESSSPLLHFEELMTSSSPEVGSEPAVNVTLTTMQMVELVYVSVNAVVSLVGNSLSLAVFTTSRLRGTPSSGYLAALAVADTGSATSVAFLRSVIMVGSGPTVLFCRIGPFLKDLCAFLSSWFVVCFTAERYVSVCHPLRAPRIFARLREGRVVLVLTLVAAALYVYALVPGEENHVFNEESMLSCGYPSSATFWNYHFSLHYVTYVCVYVVPMTMIMILNGFIISSICRHSRDSHLDSRVMEDRRAQSVNITRTLLLVSLVFLVCNFPLQTYFMLFKLNVDSIGWIWLACWMLFYANFSCNFFLYALSGTKFRASLKELLEINCNRQQPTNRYEEDRQMRTLTSHLSPSAEPQPPHRQVRHSVVPTLTGNAFPVTL